jgi:hypothetical protein
MNYDEMEYAVSQAKQTINLADIAVRKTASLAAGRLRIANVSHADLVALKLELRDYNAHTGNWKEIK